MKITKRQLRRIIKEQADYMGHHDQLGYYMSSKQNDIDALREIPPLKVPDDLPKFSAEEVWGVPHIPRAFGTREFAPGFHAPNGYFVVESDEDMLALVVDTQGFNYARYTALIGESDDAEWYDDDLHIKSTDV